ncbi:Per1-domain-containing protein [Acaromyces ingoldii]|uniref:Per1-domain-containing protein n=1 Tax=Acaromyces ingoldii TaxID=215250 RepID=A0A316YQM0_9BASI|nr:Per1-domain-containing protein [Acaromyces ingoldii]PWN91531.1 Per1-domain-containing protein [Acaromyces ingoldii]
MALARGKRRRRRRRLRLADVVFPLAILFFLASSVLPTVSASQGDRSPEYQSCVSSCTKDSCSGDPEWDDGTAKTTRLPMMLRLTFWNCIDDCKYHCTHRVTNAAQSRVRKIREETRALVDAKGAAEDWSMAKQRSVAEQMVKERLDAMRPVEKQMVQFHGKWVFVRFLGCQEPMSVLFSLMNFFVHQRAVRQLGKHIPEAFPLKLVYILHALVSCNAWFWSAVFHARDKNFTERMDYFSAGAVVLGGLFFSLSRLFRLAPGTVAFGLLARICGACLGLHILYLSFGRFDYSYNMTANVVVGLAHSLLWLAYSFSPSAFAARSLGSSLSDRYSASRAAMRASRPPSGIAGAAAAGSPPPGTTAHSNGGSPPAPVSAAIPPPSSSKRARHQLRKIVFLLLAASALELLDFPPILRALDAHALWHLATVPLASMWYGWLIEDARECVASGFFVGEGIKGPKLLTEGSAAAAEVVVPALERAKEWASSAASSAAASARHRGINFDWDNLQGAASASGVELNALTHKLNALARGTLNGIGGGHGGQGHANSASTPHVVVPGVAVGGSTTPGVDLGAGGGGGSSSREREKQRELGDRGIV